MRRALLTAALALLPSGAALAGPETWAEALDSCLAPIERVEDSAECVTAFIEVCVTEAQATEADAPAFCAAEETKAWEAKMQASLAGVVARAEAAGAGPAAEAAQAAWLAARDADCALSAAMAGAEGAAATQTCLLHATLNRYIRLEILAQGGF